MTEKTYDVGYGKPPKHAQFKKGQSGNLKGRPKGILNFATLLERTLRERVMIKENGKNKTISKLEAAITQLTNKAASGDLKAFQLLTSLKRSIDEGATNDAVPTSVTHEVDERLVLGILKRIEAANKEDVENANDRIRE